MNYEQQKGYDFATGAIKAASVFILWVLFGSILLNLVRNAGSWGVDDSDRSPWDRSGLTVHTDAKTGLQYLSDGNGGLVRR